MDLSATQKPANGIGSVDNALRLLLLIQEPPSSVKAVEAPVQTFVMPPIAGTAALIKTVVVVVHPVGKV